jgi:hypothetical protein
MSTNAIPQPLWAQAQVLEQRPPERAQEPGLLLFYRIRPTRWQTRQRRAAGYVSRVSPEEISIRNEHNGKMLTFTLQYLSADKPLLLQKHHGAKAVF